MSVRRGAAKRHVLPDNPVWVDIPRSDGGAQLPTNTERIVDSDGQVNYMRPVSIDEALSIMWRNQIGPRIAAVLGLPCKSCNVLSALLLNRRWRMQRARRTC